MAPQKRYSKGSRKITNYASSSRARDCAKLSAAASSIQSAWRRRRKVVAGPAKKKGSVAKALSQVAERKIQELIPQHMVKPYAQLQSPSNGPVYYRNFILGDAPSDWTGPIGSTSGPNYEPLGGYTFPQGTGSNGRIGRYMFLERCNMNMTVSLNSVASRNTQPTQFRVLLYKFKRNDALGKIGNPNTDLFMSSSGGQLGINTFFDNGLAPGSASFNLMNAIVNRKNYQIYKDEKFILTPQVTIPSGGGYAPLSHSGALQKEFQFVLNHNEKTAFDAASKPVDLQYQYAITILSAPMGDLDQLNLNEWRVSIRGTTSALDS